MYESSMFIVKYANTRAQILLVCYLSKHFETTKFMQINFPMNLCLFTIPHALLHVSSHYLLLLRTT